MAEFLAATAAAFCAGVVASMGLGGGFVLIIYLAAFLAMPQLEAQGVNLLFFLPIAIFALILHTKAKLVIWRVVPLICLSGLAGALGGAWLATLLDGRLLQRLFAVLLIYVGLRELFHKAQKKEGGQQ